ncbi:hypothetical protein PVK06_034045 [Gossypium arboreum]|uniref:Uncharacterized protein n=1 Tax=Gossypium arboreum TaxID=29729 RepID=A0ABR0NDN3_GOSAR|nr:hypothetical protein PVK06_034045 [Gossypium arboreum]
MLIGMRYTAFGPSNSVLSRHRFWLKYARNDGHVATSTSSIATLNFEASRAENRVNVTTWGSWCRDISVAEKMMSAAI